MTREEAAQLWEQHGQYVKRKLRTWTSAPPPGLARLSRHEVDDLHQETFLKLLEPGARFDGRAKPTTWLYKVARSAVADYQRRQGRMRKRHRSWGAEAACQLQPLDCATPARGSGDGHDDHDTGEPIELPDEPADANEQNAQQQDDEQLEREQAQRQESREDDRRARFVYQEPLQEAVVGADDQGLVQHDAMQAEAAQAAAVALTETLDPRLVRIAKLIVEEGLTQQEAAKKEGLTAKTFRNLVHAAAKRLGIRVQRRRHAPRQVPPA